MSGFRVCGGVTEVRGSDPLELEWQAIVSCLTQVLGMESRSFGRTLSALTTEPSLRPPEACVSFDILSKFNREFSHNKDSCTIWSSYLNAFLCEFRACTPNSYPSRGLLPVEFSFLWPEWQFPGLSVHGGPTVPLWQICLVHLILIHVYSHEQLILKMFVNTRVLCVLLKPGADKRNHYSIIFSFCTISFKILTCHLCLAGEAAAHADEIQPAWNQRHGAAWMSGASSRAWLLAQWGSFVALCEKQTRFSQMIFPCYLWHGEELTDGNVTTPCFGRRAWSWCTISPSLSLLLEWLSQREMSTTSWLAVRKVPSTQLVVMEGDFSVFFLMTWSSCSKFLPSRL